MSVVKKMDVSEVRDACARAVAAQQQLPKANEAVMDALLAHDPAALESARSRRAFLESEWEEAVAAVVALDALDALDRCLSGKPAESAA